MKLSTKEDFEKCLSDDDTKIFKAIENALKDLPFGQIEIDLKINRGTNIRFRPGSVEHSPVCSKIFIIGNPKELALVSYERKS